MYACVYAQDADASYDINELDNDPMPRYDAADDNRYLPVYFIYLFIYLFIIMQYRRVTDRQTRQQLIRALG